MNCDPIGLRARLTPECPALWWRDRWYSYAELDQRARRLAAGLAAEGVRKDDRVGILALNHIAHIDLVLAAPKLGCIYTPFNYRLSAPEQRQLADDLEPALMFCDERHRALATACKRPLLALETYEIWLAAAGDPPPAPPLSGDDTHMLLLTGGSTGLPKAAMIPYRQNFHNAANTAIGWGINAGHCAIQTTPCFHAALNAFTTPLLWLGGRVVLTETFDAGEFLELTERLRVTHWFMVPTMYQMLAEHPRFASADVSSVAWAISGGAPCPPRLAQAFRARGIRFKQGYGMTEAGVNCFTISLDEADAQPESVGRPMPGLAAVIRRADGVPCADGEVGELTLSGPVLCSGYYRREQETAESFRDGWLWTGDLARRASDGLFTIAGRRKEMFISGGENVYPVEIESALYQLGEVAECAVLSVPDAHWGEVGLAAVAPKAGARLDLESLKRELRQRLAAYKLPREWLVLETLPKTGAGKFNKPALRKLFLDGQRKSA